MFLTGNSPEVSRIFEALGNSQAHVKSLTLKFDSQGLAIVTVERFIKTDGEEIDAAADLLENFALVRKDPHELPAQTERTAPADATHYHPQEIPTRYPLELTPDLHVCLWSENGSFKWSIGYWVDDREGSDFNFVGNRPLCSRVNWQHLREILAQGQAMADVRHTARHGHPMVRYHGENSH